MVQPDASNALARLAPRHRSLSRVETDIRRCGPNRAGPGYGRRFVSASRRMFKLCIRLEPHQTLRIGHSTPSSRPRRHATRRGSRLASVSAQPKTR